MELRIPGTQKAKNLIDFEASVDLEEGLVKAAKWYENNLDTLPELPDLFSSK